MRFTIVLIGLLFFFLNGLNAQQTTFTDDEIIQQRIEGIAENIESEDIDLTTLLEDLEFFMENPININNTDALEELKNIYLLSEFEIMAIRRHILMNGNLLSIYELQSISGLSDEAIKRILPFIKVSEKVESFRYNWNDVFKEGKNEVLIRYTRILEDQPGYQSVSDSVLLENPNAVYLGNKDKVFARYRFNYANHLRFGITAEKDEGEEFFKGTQKQGFDFYSAHFYIRDVGFMEAVSIGDYQLEVGQGLTLWTSRAFGKNGSNVLGVKRNARGIKPYTSVNEGVFLRGGAAQLKFGNMHFLAFYSNKNYDANVSSVDTLNNDLTFSSLKISGLHRTPGELEEKNLVSLQHIGGRLSYEKNETQLGITALNAMYPSGYHPNVQLYSEPSLAYIEGNNNPVVLGVDYNHTWRNMNIYGEIAKGESGGWAQIHGLMVSLSHKVSALISYRNYATDFHYLASNPIKESAVVNEKGMYMALEVKPSTKWTLSAYADYFKFPWIRYQVDKPSVGVEYVVQATYKPSRKSEIYVRYRSEQKEVNNNTSESGLSSASTAVRNYYRLNCRYPLENGFVMRSRIEYLNLLTQDGENENGLLVFQDIMYEPIGKAFSFSSRIGFFQTDSYNTRIYAYENDVLYAFSIPAYYYKGMRTQLTMQYRFSKRFRVWLRFAQWYYSNKDTLGSGKDEISGPAKTQIRLQLRLDI